MTFDELDNRMRIYETAHDQCVLPGIWIVVRLDGRGFTRLTKEVYAFDAPFDERFRDHMLATIEHLMQCGFSVVYGYTQSDEISLLLSRDENTFARKERKLVSVLAGEASACFSLRLRGQACFDGRLSLLPRDEDVVDYFRWRNEDAARNALNGHCYWMLRRQGQSEHEATQALVGVSVAAKNELLFQNGINFNDVPLWQKRGVGVYWENYLKDALNPKTGEQMSAQRRRLKRDLNLAMRDEYSDFVRSFLTSTTLAP